MKLKTDAEINELSLREYPINISMADAYHKAYTQAQQDLLASASEGYQDWFLNNLYLEISSNEFAKMAWQAVKLSDAKEYEELKKQRDIALNDLSIEAKEVERLRQEFYLRNQYKLNQEGLDKAHAIYEAEIEELRKDLLYFWTWIVGGYESRPETRLRNELDIMEEKYPWLRCETRESPMHNLSETPNISKEGVK